MQFASNNDALVVVWLQTVTFLCFSQGFKLLPSPFSYHGELSEESFRVLRWLSAPEMHRSAHPKWTDLWNRALNRASLHLRVTFSRHWYYAVILKPDLHQYLSGMCNICHTLQSLKIMLWSSLDLIHSNKSRLILYRL